LQSFVNLPLIVITISHNRYIRNVNTTCNLSKTSQMTFPICNSARLLRCSCFYLGVTSLRKLDTFKLRVRVSHRDQEEYFSVHKRHHCVKYQSVLCPDGIIASLVGPYPGRRHDAGIFRKSNLCNQLEQRARFGINEKYVLYGNPAYPIQELLLQQNRFLMASGGDAQLTPISCSILTGRGGSVV
jgi:hypothetical protein